MVETNDKGGAGEEKARRTVAFAGDRDETLALTAFVTFGNEQLKQAQNPSAYMDDVRKALYQQIWTHAAEIMASDGQVTMVKFSQIQLSPSTVGYTRAEVTAYLLPVAQLEDVTVEVEGGEYKSVDPQAPQEQATGVERGFEIERAGKGAIRPFDSIWVNPKAGGKSN